MIVLLIIFALVFLQKALVVFGLFARFKKVEPIPDDELPTVSILIPARNEERNIADCIDSLLRVDYPRHNLEIIIGNDESVDQTAAIVSQYTAQHQFIKLFEVANEYHHLVARSNVLAQLVRESSGELIVFLDADMQVSVGWLKNMVFPACQGYNLVSGYTKVFGRGWFARFQQLDWLNVLALLKVAADLGRPGTAIGNNMLVNKNAYLSVGGYEKIGPTFTEDNDLTLTLRENGHDLFQMATSHFATTKPVRSWSMLMKQRNRWMQGAFRQPWFKLLPLIFARTFVFWGLLMCIWTYEWGLAFIGHIVIIDIYVAVFMYIKAGITTNIFYAIIAPIFNSLLDTFTLLIYPWNQKMVWKGRRL